MPRLREFDHFECELSCEEFWLENYDDLVETPDSVEKNSVRDEEDDNLK